MKNSRFQKNMICHHFSTSTNHPKSQNKLPKVSPRDLICLSHFLSITLGSQSVPADLHFEPSGIDFGSQIHIISRAWGPITLRNERFTPLRHAQPVNRCPRNDNEVWAHRCRSVIRPHRFRKRFQPRIAEFQSGGRR